MESRKSRVPKLERHAPQADPGQSQASLPLVEQVTQSPAQHSAREVGDGPTTQLLARIHAANAALDTRGKTTAPVTVVIPAWLKNDQDVTWLLEALESVLEQTVYVAVIIVENGSEFLPDLSEPAAVRILHSDKGLSCARNAGIRASDTEFFFPLDANDWLPDNALEIAYTKRPAKGFLYGSTMLFQQARGMGDQHLYTAKPYDFREVMKMVYFPNGALQRKADWEQAGGYRESLPFLEDWDYWMTCGELGICGTAIPDVLYWYRQHSGIVATNNHSQEWEDVKRLIQSYHKQIYKGVFPPMCCGNKANAATPWVAPTAAALVPGGDGMLLIEYQGGNVGKMPYYGPVTKTRYVVSGTQRQLYIDVRDAVTGSRTNPGFLEMTDHGAQLFKQVEAEPA